MKFMNIELKKIWYYLAIILLLFVLSLYFRLIKWSNFEGFTPSSVIINPNFSIPDISANSYKYISDVSTITGWTFSGNAGTLITNGQNPWNNSTFPPGTTQALSIQQSSGNYTVSQPLTLTPGTYTVKFYARPRPDSYYNVSQKMTASLNGSSVSTSFSPSDGWILYSLSTVITTQNTYPLSFLFSSDSKDTSISLTGINIIQTQTPTPTPTPTPNPTPTPTPTPTPSLPSVPSTSTPIPISSTTSVPSTSSTSVLPVPISSQIPSSSIQSSSPTSQSSIYASIYRQLNQF